MTQLQSGYQRRRGRNYRPAGTRWALCAGAIALAACTFEDTREHCASSKDCTSDEVCYQRFCIPADDTDSSGRSSGSQSSEVAGSGGGGEGGRSAGASRGNTGTMQNANTAAGKGGASGARSGSGGMSTPVGVPTAGSGGMSTPIGVPAAGNGGMSGGGATPAAGSGGAPPAGDCRDGDERQCALSAPNASDGCNRGSQRCAGGTWGTCVAQPAPAPESCNGRDDDCDALVDEQSDVDCFPNGQAGCTSDVGGHFSCLGACAIGKRACVQGQLAECSGFHAPAAEVCTPAGALAADENCNGMIDETCACQSGEARSCYTGPDGTLNVGKCVAGTQTCTNGALDSCLNAVVPAPETCNNIDDDCNGKVDDKIDLQTDVMNCGACGKVCASGEGCCAGKCVKTATDGNNCGTCGTKCAGGSKCEAGKCTADMPPPPMPGTCTPACAAGQTCCAGSCVDTKIDLKNCGGCATACTAGMQPGCCDGKCVDLVSNAHCGQCGKDCSLLGDGSITCSCTRDAGGVIACTGPVLNLCL